MKTSLRWLSFLCMVALMAVACSSKKKGSSPAERRGGLTTDDQSSERDSQLAAQSPEVATKFYYSDVQIVSQTEVDGACSEDKRIQEEYVEEPKISLNEQKQLVMPLGPDSFRLFSINVNVQLTGFDSARYSFTALDGVVPKKVQVRGVTRFKRKPGNILELQYLDQLVSMVLQITPVHSFTAVEEREGCRILHHVNVFAENTTYYPKAVSED